MLRESATDVGRPARGQSPRLAAIADTVVVTFGLAVIFGVMLAAARLLNP
jgi:hypothetical protein